MQKPRAAGRIQHAPQRGASGFPRSAWEPEKHPPVWKMRLYRVHSVMVGLPMAVEMQQHQIIQPVVAVVAIHMMQVHFVFLLYHLPA